MTDMMLASSDRDRTLFQSLIDARHTHGAGHLVLEDVEQRPLSYRRLMTGAFALGRGIARDTEPGERVAVLLPNVLGAAVTFFALHAWGRVPAMLNFSTGAASAVLACRAAQVGYLLTSRRFVEMGTAGGPDRRHPGDRGQGDLPGGPARRACRPWTSSSGSWAGPCPNSPTGSPAAAATPRDRRWSCSPPGPRGPPRGWS